MPDEKTADNAEPAAKAVTLRSVLSPAQVAACPDPRVLDHVLSPTELATLKKLNSGASPAASSAVASSPPAFSAGESVPDVSDADLVAHFQRLNEESGDPSAMPLASETYLDQPKHKRLQWPARDVRKAYRERLLGESESPVLAMGDVALARIDCSAIENFRTPDPTKFQVLKASMNSKIGLLEPVILMPDPRRSDHFVCLAGRDRVEAARESGWLTIPAIIREVHSEEDAMLIGLIENNARRNFTAFELAASVELIARRFLTSVSDIAKLLGYSPGHLFSLLRFLSNLPSDVITDWRQAHPLLTHRCLERLCREPDPSATWQAMRMRHAIAESKDPLVSVPVEETADDSTTEFKRPSGSRILKFIDILNRSEMPSEPAKVLALVVGAMNWARGASPTVPFVMAPALRRRRFRRLASEPTSLPEQQSA